MADQEKARKKKDVAENPNTLVVQFQITQQQLQNLLIQKESLRLSIMEIERAAEELEKSKDKTAYKITGSIMISKPVGELKEDLKETKELLKVRVESLEKTEKRLTDKLKGLQDKLKEILK